MTDLQVYALCNRIPGLLAIDSEVKGLKYIIDGEGQGIVISGMRGKTGLSIARAKAVAVELAQILETMGVAV